MDPRSRPSPRKVRRDDSASSGIDAERDMHGRDDRGEARHDIQYRLLWLCLPLVTRCTEYEGLRLPALLPPNQVRQAA